MNFENKIDPYNSEESFDLSGIISSRETDNYSNDFDLSGIISQKTVEVKEDIPIQRTIPKELQKEIIGKSKSKILNNNVMVGGVSYNTLVSKKKDSTHKEYIRTYGGVSNPLRESLSNLSDVMRIQEDIIRHDISGEYTIIIPSITANDVSRISEDITYEGVEHILDSLYNSSFIDSNPLVGEKNNKNLSLFQKNIKTTLNVLETLTKTLNNRYN